MNRHSRAAAAFVSFLALASALAVAAARGDDVALRATKLHREAIVVDTHEDVPWKLWKKWVDLATPGATPDVDIPRLKKGGVTAPFFAVYVPSSREKAGTAAKEALDVIDLVDRVVASHPEVFVAATSVADIRAAKKAGKIAILKGLEGGHAIENSLARLRIFAHLGVRYMTLTHTAANGWADSSGPFWEHDWEPRKAASHDGLTDFGRHVVREMNRIGMAIDVSHVSDEVISQTLQVSRAPIFASHSSCRAIANMPRNLTDEQIRGIAEKGGVVMINVSSAFLSQNSFDAMRRFSISIGPRIEALRVKYAADPVKLEDESQKVWESFRPVRASWTKIVDHIEHVLRIAPGAAGIGTDFDGIEDDPEGFDDVSMLPKITEELLRRGHSADEVRGVLGEDFLRFLVRVEATAVALRDEPPDTTLFPVRP
jgi:membrane dipeptidase